MKLSPSVALVCLVSIVTLDACVCGIPSAKQFIVTPSFNKDEDCNLEDLVPLRGPALHTLLKGLASLLVQLYPEICPRCTKPKKTEESIKIFRQIMQIPSPVYPVQQPCAMCKPQQPCAIQQQPCTIQQQPCNQFYPCTPSPVQSAQSCQQRYFPSQYCQPPIAEQNQILPDPCCCC